MKLKETLRQIIREEVSRVLTETTVTVNEYDNDSDGPFENNDGWDKNALQDVGLIEWLDEVQRISYEIHNARRGAYAVSGDTAEDLYADLTALNKSLERILREMTSYMR